MPDFSAFEKSTQDRTSRAAQMRRDLLLPILDEMAPSEAISRGKSSTRRSKPHPKIPSMNPQANRPP